MHRCATQLYYRLFYFLEHCGLLDPVNESHIFALHYIFLSRIKSSLDAFRNGWNEHGVRTKGNHSPLQLYHAGTLRLQNSGLEAMDLFSMIDDDYGLDPEAPYPTGEESQVCALLLLLDLVYSSYCAYRVLLFQLLLSLFLTRPMSSYIY